MHEAILLFLGLTLVPSLAVAQPAGAQEDASTHLRNIAARYTDTPSNRGLLATAAAELDVAGDHAEQAIEAVEDEEGLDEIKVHAGHIINCVDPALEEDGPCLGYGIKKAANHTIDEMEAAAAVADASAAVRILSRHIVASTRNSIRIADLVVETARRLQAATEVEEAAEIATLLQEMVGQINSGFDLDDDGVIGETEGGLSQTSQRATLLMRAEGIPTPGELRQ
jgi:hypothetical protein